MKLSLLLLGILLICIKANATSYYFSTSGSDANTGITSASPFKTITKLNALILKPGDSILFKCGDTLRGQINLNYSGTASLPIVFTSYGSGVKPVISGAEPITGWSANGSVYQATFKQNMNNFFVNHKEQMLARYPNDHQYLTVDSAQKFYLKDASITSLSTSLISNSKICIHTAQWCWEKTAVQSVAADKITFSSGVTINAISNYGYFLYDNILHLDTAKEWKYDNTAQLLTYMPPAGQNPSLQTCEGSVYINGISIDSTSSYILIKGLAFEKQSNAGVEISAANNRYIKIDSCYFARQYNHGVHDMGKYNEVSNSYFREVDGIAVFVNNTGSNSTIHHNIFRNIGEFRNGGIGTQINLTAIKAAFVDSTYSHHNDIDSTGYCGIAVDGNYHLVEKNIIKNAMLINNDGGALKTFGINSGNITFKNNFISTSDGNTEGTNNGSFITPAIYFDNESHNSIAQDNTIYNRTKKGFFLNSGTQENTIRGNVVYGFNFGIDLNGDSSRVGGDNWPAMKGMIVKDNKLFALSSNGIAIKQTDYSNNYTGVVIDSNYYFQPYNTLYASRNSGPLLTFPQWKNTGNDAHTIVDNFKWATGIDSSKIFLNPTDNAVVQDLLGWKWKDLDGNIVTSLTLQPWTSKIMIRTNVTNVNVTVNAVTKCANDAAVTIAATALQSGTYSYVWTVPSGVTNPGNVQSFSATVAGTYGVTITDQSSGGAGSGSAILTVNPNPAVTVNSPARCSAGAAVSITATPSPAGTYNYAWTVPAGVTGPGNVASFSVTVAGTHTVIITNATTGCTGTGSGTLTVNPSPAVTVNSPAICITGSSTIAATPSPGGTYNYAWTVPSGATNPGSIASFSATVAGTYTVIITNATTGCTATGSGTLTVNSIPSAPTVSAVSYCQGSTATALTATTGSGNTLLWYTQATGGTASATAPTPSTAAAGSADFYVSQVTTSGSCESQRAKLTVTVNAIPATPTITRDANNNLVSSALTGNLWYKEGVALTDTTQKYKPTIAGNYSVKTTQNGCTSAMSANFNYTITAIVNLSNSQYIKLYPNPVRQDLRIDYKIDGQYQLRLMIYDLNGKLVLDKNKMSTGSLFSLKELSSGTYLISIHDTKGKLIYTDKIIKE
ncbi:MAG: Right-handed parallel beta-helix repeat-containing protein [Sediminibacterium sp.]|nr:Right-handed parallel beta-helix repeat-containing protein [Sediminibacterium sp.]